MDGFSCDCSVCIFWASHAAGWLAPHRAKKPGREHMQFHVEAAVPLIGVVASYRGYLLLPEEKA
jgi:hypothetical protein